VIVYTAIFGGYDNLLDPMEDYEGVDFVCFTDDPNMKSDIWDVRVYQPRYGDPRHDAKVFKILPHQFFPNHDCSLWIDGCYRLVRNPSDLLKFFGSHSMACMEHPQRDCIYDELRASLLIGWAGVGDISRQVERYKQEGYPKNNGLAYGGFLLRRHNDAVVSAVMDDWWHEICTESRRDQISFPYVARKHGFGWGIIPGTNFENEFMCPVVDNTPHCRLHGLWPLL